MRSKKTVRVVTIGGGHGQPVAIRAALALGAHVTAIPSVADEGGCSGALRDRTGLPPPGDARRCLATLAIDERRSRSFERRGEEHDALRGRVLGNVLLAGLARQHRSFQAACDRAGEWLGARGRVTPAALSAMTLLAVDENGDLHLGELAIAGAPSTIVRMEALPGATANPDAIHAIQEADLVILGPGSFFTSVLAALSGPGIAAALVASRAPVVWLANLRSEGPQTDGLTLRGYAEALRRHVRHAAGAPLAKLTVIADGERSTRSAIDPETPLHRARLVSDPAAGHDPDLVAKVLADTLLDDPHVAPTRPALGVPRPRRPGIAYRSTVPARGLLLARLSVSHGTDALRAVPSR